MDLGDIFEKDSIKTVIEDIQKKGGGCGADGIETEELALYVDKHNIVDQIIRGEYEPRVAMILRMHTGGGKERKIYKISNVDRMVLKVLHKGIREVIDSQLSDHCISYRQGFGVTDCCGYITEALDRGYKYTVRIDIKDYFDNIDISQMMSLLHPLIDDDRVYSLIDRMLHMPVENNYFIERHSRGLIQGSSLSPILSDLYLSAFDNYVTEEITDLYFRFSDDIALFFELREEALTSYEKCVGMLRDEFGLEVNKRKSGVFPVMSRSYLGYTIIESVKDHSYEIIKIDKDHRVYHHWHRSGLKEYRTEYDIISNGILTCKDMTLLFEAEDKKIRIPIETVRNINIFSEVNITGNLLKFISTRKITLTVFDSYGNIIGRWIPDNCMARSDVLLAQTTLYNDSKKRLALAKAFVNGELHNLKANLSYYKKHSSDMNISASILALNSSIEEAKTCGDYKKLLLIEARARETYYGCFNAILPADDFEFVGRSRRPPEDAINALISFGNTVMYNYVSNEICKTALNPKIGYLHATNKRAESLNLDIAEIFKPVIIDRVIFSLINKKMINESVHFDYDEKSVRLSPEGKRIFLTNYYKRMDSEIMHKGKRMSYRQIIWEEVLAVMRHITGDAEYKPFHYRV